MTCSNTRMEKNPGTGAILIQHTRLWEKSFSPPKETSIKYLSGTVESGTSSGSFRQKEPFHLTHQSWRELTDVTAGWGRTIQNKRRYFLMSQRVRVSTGYSKGKRALPCLSKNAKNADLLSSREIKCPDTVASMLCQNNHGQFEYGPICLINTPICGFVAYFLNMSAVNKSAQLSHTAIKCVFSWKH